MKPFERTNVTITRTSKNGEAEPIDKNDLELRKITSRISNSIRNIPKTPPSLDSFEPLFTEPASSDSVEQIGSSLYIHGWNTTKEHLILLQHYDISELNEDASLRYFTILYSVYEKSGEYSLAFETVKQVLAFKSIHTNPEEVALWRNALGIILIKLDHPHVDTHYKNLISFAEKNQTNKELAWVYHNWASHKRAKGNIEEAILLYERETPLKKKEGNWELFKHYGFIAETLESLDARRAIGYYQKALEVAKGLEGMGAEHRAEALYRAARLQLTYLEPDDVLDVALKSFEIFDSLHGYENRAAWAAGLVAMAYDYLDNAEERDKYTDIRDKYLDNFGSDKEKFQKHLGELFLADDSGDQIKQLESWVNEPGNEHQLLMWTTVICTDLLHHAENQQVLSHTEYILQKYGNGCLPGSKIAESLSLIYWVQAKAAGKSSKEGLEYESLQKAVELDPNNRNASIELALKALNHNNLGLAIRLSKQLVKSAPDAPGAPRILARAYLKEDSLDEAIATLKNAVKNFPTHSELSEELIEIENIKLGLLDKAASKYFSFPEPSPIHSSRESHHGLPEFRQLPTFHRTIIDYVKHYFEQLQKTPPRFLRELVFDENDFRDEFERQLSYSFKQLAGEVKHGDGRTDLIIWPKDDANLNKLVFEFKIWGRNDYKETASQLMKYLTDFQLFGAILMINPNKKSIAEKYRKQVIYEQPTYCGGSFRRSPVDLTEPNFDHFYSEHLNPRGKKVGIFHFLFNC